MPNRRPEPGADDLLIKIAAIVIVLAAVAWGFNKVRDGVDARAEVIAESRPAVPADAPPPQVDAPPSNLSESARRGMQLLRKCSGASGSHYTTDECPDGTDQVSARLIPIDHSRGSNLQSGQAQLQRAQRDFAQATGQDQPQPWYPTGVETPANSRMSECARVTALRDEAYRLRGNNRDFNFVRYWQDRVFEACKGT